MLSPEKMEIQIGEVLTNDGLDDRRTQHISLIKDGTLLARVEAYLNADCYSAYWLMPLSPEVFIQLAEKCLAYYESRYPFGVKDLNEELFDISAPPETDDPLLPAMQQGVIVDTKVMDDQGEFAQYFTYELAYRRPLSWSAMVTAIPEEEEIVRVRFNTLIGDFYAQLDEVGILRYGFLSHLAQMDGFSELMSESSDGVISVEQAQQFFDTMVVLFQ